MKHPIIPCYLPANHVPGGKSIGRDLDVRGIRGRIKVNLAMLLFLIAIIPAASQPLEKHSAISGFLDLNLYQDTRGFSVMTYNVLAKLPYRFQYFSLTNHQSSEKPFELRSYYSEQNLRWAIHRHKPLDLTAQYVIRKEAANDLRFGIRWRANASKKLASFFKKLHFSYSINPMLIQFRRNSGVNFMTMIEHVYRINVAPALLDNRLYISGFADQNFKHEQGGIACKWVSEHQMGIRIVGQLFAVLEYRINDFLNSDNHGFGYGIEYKVTF